MSERLWSMILAGGAGTRLRETTRALGESAIPKQFCRFGGRRSLLRRTFDRLEPLVPASRTVVVVDRLWCDRAMTGVPEGATILAQPLDRGTAVGVLLPLLHILDADPGAVVVLQPSDHGITDAETYRRCLADAAAIVTEGRAGIILIGSRATSPRPDFGWIVPAGPVAPGVFAVDRFVEKPGPDQAARLLAEGALWNTMILVARADALLELFLEREPGLVRSLQRAGRSLRRLYARLPVQDFSRDVLAGARGLAVLAMPAGADWSDLGTPERLRSWLVALGRDELSTLVP